MAVTYFFEKALKKDKLLIVIAALLAERDQVIEQNEVMI